MKYGRSASLVNSGVTWQKLGFSVAELGEPDGIVTVQVTGLPMSHDTNGVVSAVSITSTDRIAQ